MSIWSPIGANRVVYGLSGGCEALSAADATLAANVRLLRLMLCLAAYPASSVANTAHLALSCLFGHESSSFGPVLPIWWPMWLIWPRFAYSVTNSDRLAANRAK